MTGTCIKEENLTQTDICTEDKMKTMGEGGQVIGVIHLQARCSSWSVHNAVASQLHFSFTTTCDTPSLSY